MEGKGREKKMKQNVSFKHKDCEEMKEYKYNHLGNLEADIDSNVSKNSKSIFQKFACQGNS